VSIGASPTDRTVLWQIGLGMALLAGWEMAGREAIGRWISRPALVIERLIVWARGDLWLHLGTTLAELVIGLIPGVAFGVLLGLLLGRSPVVAGVLRPMIVALYSIPLISLAPLFIMFFGIGMLPKIVLVAIVVFFLLFFNTFTGVERVDPDLISGIELMGARQEERFRKVVLPAATVWIIGGIKIAIPYALVATITGELLSARNGLGFLLNRASEQYDMTGLYAVLFLLMLLGLGLGEAANRFERRALRWRP
jgi:NitT/TauT family transport system permease protein